MDPALTGSLIAALIALIGVVLHKSRCITTCGDDGGWSVTLAFTETPLPDKSALETIELQNDTLLYRKRD